MESHSRRQGKRVTAGHTSLIEGLDRFLRILEDWPEITTIRIGKITISHTVGRKHNKPSPIRQPPRSIGLGGGFNFKATRWAMASNRITGILCRASYGRAYQEVILTSDDYRALRARLVKEGYLSDE